MRRSEDHLRATHVAFVLHGNVGRVRPACAGWKTRALLATDAAYASLDEGVRTVLSQVLARAQACGLESRVLELARSNAFLACAHQEAVLNIFSCAPLSKALVDDVQAALAFSPLVKLWKELSRVAGDTEARALFVELARAPGFAALDARDAITVLRCAAGPRAATHAPKARQAFLDQAWSTRRTAMHARVRDPEFRGATAREQAEMLLEYLHTPEHPAYFLHAGTFRGRATVTLGDPATHPSLSWSRAPRRIVGRETAARIESPFYETGQRASFKRIDLTRLEELFFIEWIEANHTINPSESLRLLPTRQKFFEPAFAYVLRLAQRRGDGVADQGTIRGERNARDAADFLAQLLGSQHQDSGQPETKPSASNAGPQPAIATRRR